MPSPPSRGLIPPPANAVALHVLLMRVSHAPDAFAVFDLRPDSVYTHADFMARAAEIQRALTRDEYRRHPSPVRRMLFPVIVRAYSRVAWAMRVVHARLEALDAHYENETDAEA
jgi:hypothetical protein